MIRFTRAMTSNLNLLLRLTERQVSERYRGSLLGCLWAVCQPLLMMAVYTFVFSTVFKSKWMGAEESGSAGYASYLFAGLIVFTMFSESIGNASSIIRSNPNYVTKVVFPLELLSSAQVLAALNNAFIGLIVLFAYSGIVLGKITWTMLLAPIVWIPLTLICLGICWILNSIGTYLKDLDQLTPLLITISMFLSAVFYPIEALPDSVIKLMALNPIAQTIGQTRIVCLQGEMPSLRFLAVWTAIGLIFAEGGYRMFQKVRRGFADVV